MGAFGIGERNERGDRLIEFAEERKLTIANTQYQKQKTKKTKNPNNNKTHTQENNKTTTTTTITKQILDLGVTRWRS